MAFFLLAVTFSAWAAWFAFAIGRATADRWVNINHHQLALFLAGLRDQDDLLPFLSPEERLQAEDLLDDYKRIAYRAEMESERGSVSVVSVVLIGVAAITMGSILLMACNPKPSLAEGKVIEKIYDDEDSWYQSGYTIDGGRTCTGGFNGQSQTCFDNPDTHIPGQWHSEPERFLFKLQAQDPDDATKNITDTVTVPESFWNEVRVGQWVDVKSMEIVQR